MRFATWLRRAGWLTALGLMGLGSAALRADDGAAGDEPAPPAKEAAPATPEPPQAGESPRPPRAPRHPIAVRMPKYRLDVHVMPVPKALDEQLGLKGEGVVVGHVSPEGPAGKAGIKEHDVVLAVGDKSLKDPSDLMDAVDASEGKELAIKLLRGGKPMTVTVTPGKREEGGAGGLDVGRLRLDLRDIGEIEELRDIERKIREKLKDAGVDLRMQFIQPGRFLPEGMARLGIQQREFPDDLNVTIRKQGKNPAEIEVKRGDKTWNVKENELAKLPEDVRDHVESLLGQHPMRLNIVTDGERRPPGPPHDGPRHRGPGGPPPRPGEHGDIGPDGPPPGGPDGPPGPPRARRPGEPGEGARGRAGLERRLEQLSRELERTREQLEGLRRGLRDDDDDDDE